MLLFLGVVYFEDKWVREVGYENLLFINCVGEEERIEGFGESRWRLWVLGSFL